MGILLFLTTATWLLASASAIPLALGRSAFAPLHITTSASTPTVYHQDPPTHFLSPRQNPSGGITRQPFDEYDQYGQYWVCGKLGPCSGRHGWKIALLTLGACLFLYLFIVSCSACSSAFANCCGGGGGGGRRLIKEEKRVEREKKEERDRNRGLGRVRMGLFGRIKCWGRRGDKDKQERGQGSLNSRIMQDAEDRVNEHIHHSHPSTSSSAPGDKPTAPPTTDLPSPPAAVYDPARQAYVPTSDSHAGADSAAVKRQKDVDGAPLEKADSGDSNGTAVDALAGPDKGEDGEKGEKA